MTLSKDVVVDAQAVISNAVGLPGAYVSPEQSTLVVTLGTTPDAPPTAPVRSRPFHSDESMGTAKPVARLSRFLAAVLAVASAPVALPWLVIRNLRRTGPAWTIERAVLGHSPADGRLLTTALRLPAQTINSARWLAWYGALLDVVQGRRHWVGVRPRRVEYWFGLDANARDKLGFAPIGLWHPVAWTNQLACVLQVEASADLLWLARRRKGIGWRSSLGLGTLFQPLSTGKTHYRALAAT